MSRRPGAFISIIFFGFGLAVMWAGCDSRTEDAGRPPVEKGAHSFLRMAEDSMRNANFDSAIAHYQSAVQMYAISGAHDTAAYSLSQIATAYIEKRDLPAALQSIEAAESICSEHLPNGHLEYVRSQYLRGRYLLRVSRNDPARYSDCVAQFLRTLELLNAHQPSAHVLFANTHKNLGIAYWHIDNLEGALRHVHIALDHLGKMAVPDRVIEAKSYATLQLILKDLGQFDSVAIYNDLQILAAKQIEGPRGVKERVRANQNAAALYRSLGLYDRAMPYHESALKDAVFNERDPGQDLVHLGHCFRGRGDLKRAEEYYNAYKLNLDQLFHETDHFDFYAVYYNAQGNVYYDIGEFDKALEFYKKSVECREKWFGFDHPKTAIAYANISLNLIKLREYQLAQEYLKKADRIWEIQFPGKDHFLKSATHTFLGASYRHTGNYDEASKYLYQAKNYFESNVQRMEDLAEAYYELAQFYFARKAHDRAMDYCQKSLVAIVADFESTDFRENPGFQKAYSRTALLKYLEGKADILAGSDDSTRKALALSTYGLALQLADFMRGEFSEDESKLLVSEKVFAIHEKAIELCFRMHESYGDPRFPDHAFKIAEHGKARLILESISGTRAMRVAGVPEALLNLERELKVQLDFYEMQILDEERKGEVQKTEIIQRWQAVILDLRKQQDSLETLLQDSYPKYFALRNNLNTVSPDEVRKALLRENQALLEYFLGDSAIYAFVLTADTFDVLRIPRDPAFDGQITDFWTSISSGDLDTKTKDKFRNNAFALYGALVAPVEPLVSGHDLVIIPDGVLGYLPFEALLTALPDSAAAYNDMPFLLRDYLITYEYSATLLKENRNKHIAGVQNTYLGMAPTFAGRYNELPIIRETAKAIRKSIEGTLFRKN